MNTDAKSKAKLSQSLYFIRGVSIVLVVIGHVIGYDKTYGMRQAYSSDLFVLGWICDFINTFHMPTFFIASGISFAIFSNKHAGYIKFARSKFEKLLIPLIFWSPIYFVFQSLSKGKSFSFFEVIHSVLYPHEIFWFLHALIFATLFSFVYFKNFKSQAIYFFLSIIIFAIGVCLRGSMIYLYFFWNIFYAFGVFVSYYLSSLSLKVEELTLKIKFISAISGITIMLVTKYFIPLHDALDLSRIINGIIAFIIMYMIAISWKIMIEDKHIVNKLAK